MAKQDHCYSMLSLMMAFGVAISPVIGLSAEAQVQSAAKEKTYEFEYPELAVTPSASERLKIEAKTESARAWTGHVPTQLSALITLLASTQALNDPGRSKDKASDATPKVHFVGLAGSIISLGWLGATAGLSAIYRPYTKGNHDLKNVSASTKREKLSRERLAEESLEAPATLARRLKWLAVASNVGLGTLIFATAGNDMTKVMGGLAAAAGFVPLIFPEQWEVVGDAHNDYKKRIYGPIANATIYYDQTTHRSGPAINLTLNF